MNFSKVLREVAQRLDAAGVRYALIGGFALALRGVQRATMDLDFILMLEDLETANRILVELGYRREFHSENVSHYRADDREWGRIDILHAFRGPSLGMLRRAETIQIDADLRLPVVHVEDLIGLKIQAATNDPARAVGDWNDIRLLLEAAARQGAWVDWELVADYLRIFGLDTRLAELKAIHGSTQ
jgi:predicted nucleotidyltransferase